MLFFIFVVKQIFMKYIIIFLLFFQTMLSQTYDYKFANKITNGVVIKKSECKTLRVSVKETNILVHVDASGVPKYNFHVRLLTKSKDTLLNNKICKLYMLENHFLVMRS